jgi:hypothetical protein
LTEPPGHSYIYYNGPDFVSMDFIPCTSTASGSNVTTSVAVAHYGTITTVNSTTVVLACAGSLPLEATVVSPAPNTGCADTEYIRSVAPGASSSGLDPWCPFGTRYQIVGGGTFEVIVTIAWGPSSKESFDYNTQIVKDFSIG